MADAVPPRPEPSAAIEPTVRRRRLPLVLITLASVLALLTSYGRPNGSGAGDQLEQLERLGRLRGAGVLDACEFESQKAQILAAGPATAGGQV